MKITSKIWYEEYDEPKNFKLVSKISYERFFKKILNIANLEVLNYGSGIGQGTALLKNVTCYDPNEEAIELGKKYGVVITNDLNDIKDEGYDIVFCSLCLEHCLEPRTELKNMYKKLKKGGKIIIVITNFLTLGNKIPCEGTWKTHLGEEIRFKKYGFHPCNYYYNWTMDGLNNLLINVGFKVIKNKFIGYKGSRLFKKIGYNNFDLYIRLISFFGRFFKKTQMLFVAEK